MRGKLGTGKHLLETYVLLPQNVPGTAGPTAEPTPPDGDGPRETTQPGGSPPIGGTVTPGDNPANPIGGGGIFGGTPATRVPVNIPSTSSLNLLGRIESQGIKAGTQLHDLHLKVDKLTGAQLQEMLRKLPDGMTYELGLEKEQSE